MPLEDLSCAGCGAPLRTANAQGRAIVCPYCQREHVFVSPPAEPSRHEHPAGSKVVVKWGSRWWAAEVVSVEGPDRWKIHYLGWSSSWDEVVGPDRIRPADADTPKQVRPMPDKGAGEAKQGAKGGLCLLVGGVIAILITVLVMVQGGADPVRPDGRAVDATTPLAAGQPVQVEWNGSWYEAHIRAVHPDGRVRVHYEGWDASYDEDVARDRVLLLPGGESAVQPAGTVATEATELAPGQRVQIEWLGTWYEGSVLEVHPDGRVRVRYEGWSDAYDEDVPRDRVRVP